MCLTCARDHPGRAAKGGTAINIEPLRISNAYLEEDTLVVVKLSAPLDLPFPADKFSVTDASTAQSISVMSVDLPQTATPAASQSDLLALTLALAPDVSHSLFIALADSAQTHIRPRNVLNAEPYYYRGGDLGHTYQPGATAFRLWAPTASQVQLLLCDGETGPVQRQVEMQRSEAGTWYARVSGDLLNWYYLYQVSIDGTTSQAVDPYARAIAVNGARGMIVHLPATDPPAWQSDRYAELASPTDAVIYEMHVRDFSIHPDSGMVNRGKYLALTERGTHGPDNVATGIDHLKELGITHVQLQPVQAFASVDENDAGQYNWGYDPRNFNVPTGAYATTPHGTARISECKRMVQSLHSEGIGVIMDVVYNHTFARHTSDFDTLVPQYYYRTDFAGNYSNGSGVGNEIAAERPMVKKFILDSLAYWTREYHVDGFRFDLMALLGREAMRSAHELLRTINPHVLLYGEPWAGGDSTLDSDELLTSSRQQGLGVAVFNDHLRDSLCGGVFDAGSRGFVTGAWGCSDGVRRAAAGSIDDFTASAQESVNYASSHDNYTLWDKVTLSTAGDSEQERVKMDELAMAVILTSQGIAFLQGGEEMLRSKDGNYNSYNAGDGVNQFDWARKARYRQVCNYYAGLVRLRRDHPAFRMAAPDAIRAHLTFHVSPENTLLFELAGHANGDSWESILVIYNPNRADVTLRLPPGRWTIAASQERVGPEQSGQASAEVGVAAIACMILYRQAAA